MGYSKAYYEIHRKEIIAKTILWQKSNPEKVKLIMEKGMRKYRKSPKGIYRDVKQNARRKKREILSQREFIEWYLQQEQICIYCSAPPNEKRLSIDRMENSKGYVRGNLALACNDCNSVKKDILSVEEMKIIGQIVMRKRWDK